MVGNGRKNKPKWPEQSNAVNLHFMVCLQRSEWPWTLSWPPGVPDGIAWWHVQALKGYPAPRQRSPCPFCGPGKAVQSFPSVFEGEIQTFSSSRLSSQLGLSREWDLPTEHIVLQENFVYFSYSSVQQILTWTILFFILRPITQGLSPS